MKEKLKLALKDKDFSELLRGSGFSFFLRFGGLATGYLLTLIIAYLFGADGLGDYVLAITVLRLFTLLSKLGLDTTSIRFIASFTSQNKWESILKFRRKVVFILIISSLLFSFLMYVLAQPISDLINTKVEYIKLNAFFAEKRTQSCPKPRYPSVIIMAPRLKVSSNVDVAYTPIAALVAKQIIDRIQKAYAGPISTDSLRTLSEVTSSSNKNLLFDYQSLQRGHSKIAEITEDFMLSIDVYSRVKHNRLESQVKLDLIARDGFKPALSHEKLFVNRLPTKTPLRSLNVFWPKTLKIDDQKISDMVVEIGNNLRLTACKPLEARTVFSSGELRLGIGSRAGVRNGSLAYIVGGRESWTLLEVSNVTQTSAILKPINTMSNSKTLGNQTVRFIEGAM